MKNKFFLLFFAIGWFTCLHLNGTNDSPTKMRFDSLRTKAQELINTPEEILYLDSMLQLAQTIDSVHWQSQAMAFMARNYYNRMNPDSLMYWAGKLDTLALKHEHYKEFFDVFSLVCFWELYDKNYDSALDKANRLYLMAKDLDNANGLIASYETIGLIYMETFRYVEAIKSFNEGLELQNQQKNPRHAYQFQFMSYIIESYLKLKDYKNAKESLAKAYALIEQCQQKERSFPADRCLWLLNCYNIEMYVAQKLPNKAEAYIIEAEKYVDIDDFYVFCYHHLVSASYYQLLGNYTRALDKVNTVLAETGDDYLPALKMKAELLLNAGKEQEAAMLYHKSVNLIDSTYNESLSKQINQLRTIHEVDKLELRNKEIELKSKKYKLTLTSSLIILLVFVLAIVCAHYIRIRKIKNRLELSDKELKKDKELLLISEKELSIAKEKAEASNRIKDVFLANLSHEIRTPLNSIVGFSSLLGNMQHKKEAQEYASIIKQNSDMLLKLVNDAVSLSVLQTGQTSFATEEVEVCTICRKLVAYYTAKAKPGVVIEACLPCEEYSLKTDASRLHQVLENLLSNAVKFTDKGHITLSLELQEESGCARFIVTDTGCGIPEDMQEKVFASFQKVDSFVQGFGLGLTICKLIAQYLNGSIDIDPTYKEGTRMIFTHPINK
ncbi:MAG: tetratricopeptide repeat-containing sensor histidine kinase [Bacteroidaceae bacterium]|nr:tetratricopeptide repeat-containing sensor histidine kinase [Bacteroidaceae bacterium]